MSDLGPAWLRTELPQPIAAAWNISLLHHPVSGSAAAVAVETALRFVAALQAASLLAESRQLPAILRRKFDRPTLGSWCNAVDELRAAAQRPFVPALGNWPDAATRQALRDFTRLRNDLSHDQLTPLARRELDEAICERAAELLATLGWLRGLEVVIVAEQRASGRDELEGRLQRFRSDAPHPRLERARWRGRVELGRSYVCNGTHALDIEPFVRRARVGSAKNEALCLWSGLGERGDLRLRDDNADRDDWVRLVPDRRPVPFVALAVEPSATDATRPDAPSLLTEPPTLVAPVHPAARARRPRPWLALALGGAGMVLAVLAGLALGRGTTSVTKAPTATREVERSDPASPACSVPGIGGRWRFDTYVLRAKASMEYGLNVRGHYELTVGAPIDCALPFLLTKTGYTQGDTEDTTRFTNRARMKVSASGRSAAIALELRREGVRNPEIALRLSRSGDMLVGLWRHEGADWDWGGYSGAVLGTKVGASLRPEVDPQCFLDCVHDCHPGANPLDEATEPCVLDCARRLETCTR